MAKTLTKTIALLLIIYIASYAVFRTTNTETWEKDGKDYVIFPENSKLLYLTFRPLSHLDAAITGTGSHIGPHQ